MIYNFVQLLRDQFPSELFFANARSAPVGHSNVPDRCVLVRETGGPTQPWSKYRSTTVQIIARSKDTVLSRELAHSIFKFLDSRFGLVLPSVVVNGITYDEVQTAQISAIQLPYDLGFDEEGRNEYTTNYQVIIGG